MNLGEACAHHVGPCPSPCPLSSWFPSWPAALQGCIHLRLRFTHHPPPTVRAPLTFDSQQMSCPLPAMVASPSAQIQSDLYTLHILRKHTHTHVPQWTAGQVCEVPVLKEGNSTATVTVACHHLCFSPQTPEIWPLITCILFILIKDWTSTSVSFLSASILLLLAKIVITIY